MTPAKNDISESDLPNTGRPSRDALAVIGITRLEHLARHTEKEIAALHGVGPKAIRIWREALAARGLTFKAPIE